MDACACEDLRAYRRDGPTDTTRMLLELLEGDAVQRADEIPVADVVTLDRVICCYRDVHALVGRPAARVGRLYGVVLPRDRWFVRLTWLWRVAVFRRPASAH